MATLAMENPRERPSKPEVDTSNEDMSMMIDWADGPESAEGRVSGSEKGEGDCASSVTGSPAWSLSAMPTLTHARTLRSCLSTSGSSTMISTPNSSPAWSSASSITSFGPFKPSCSHGHHLSTSSAGAKSVSFADHPPTCFETWEDDAYDRSPHPVVIRLSYRDVLELREMKVELGIVTRRQAMSANAVDGGKGRNQAVQAEDSKTGESSPAETLMQRRSGGEALSLNLGGSVPAEITVATPEEDPIRGYQPPSPSVFPSSPFLVSQLQRQPHPQPPARATGVGMSVQPNLENRTHGRQRSGSHGSSRLSRKTSMDSINTSPSTATFGQEEQAEESEFQRELRQAKEELDMLAVKEMRDKEILGRGRTETPKPPPPSVTLPPRAASTAEARRAARLPLRRAASSRSAAFFEQSIQTLTPPGKSPMAPGRSARLPLRLIPDDEPREEPPLSAELATPGSTLSDASTLSARRGVQSAALQVPRIASSQHVGSLHSPLPERDVSPTTTPGFRDDSATIFVLGESSMTAKNEADEDSPNRAPTTPTGIDDCGTSSTSTTPIARASLPPRRSMSPLRSQMGCQSSFFDRVETIAKPFTTSHPAIEVEQR